MSLAAWKPVVAAIFATLMLTGCGGRAEKASETQADALDASCAAGLTEESGDHGPGGRTCPPTPVQDPNEQVFCDVVGGSLTRRECAEAAQVAASVKDGAASADVPSEMTRGVPARVTLAVGRAADRAAVEDATRQLPGQDYSYAAPIGARMMAELRGVGFTFKPSTGVTQSVTARGPTTWDWEVTPTRGGDLTLTIFTSAVYEGGGSPVPLANSIKSYPVKVQVAGQDQVRDFMDAVPAWLKSAEAIAVALGTLIVAIGGVIYAIRRFGKGKPKA